MANKLQNWIYEKGGYFWFDSPLIVKKERTITGSMITGIKWLWLTKLLWKITGHKLSYYGWMLKSKEQREFELLREFYTEAQKLVLSFPDNPDDPQEFNFPQYVIDNCKNIMAKLNAF